MLTPVIYRLSSEARNAHASATSAETSKSERYLIILYIQSDHPTQLLEHIWCDTSAFIKMFLYNEEILTSRLSHPSHWNE